MPKLPFRQNNPFTNLEELIEGTSSDSCADPVVRKKKIQTRFKECRLVLAEADVAIAAGKRLLEEFSVATKTAARVIVAKMNPDEDKVTASNKYECLIARIDQTIERLDKISVKIGKYDASGFHGLLPSTPNKE